VETTEGKGKKHRISPRKKLLVADCRGSTNAALGASHAQPVNFEKTTLNWFGFS
jgi:hypothetical protein